MIDALKLTFPGGELRKLLDERIADHEGCADRWAHEKLRTPDGHTEEAPLLPDHICTNEAERHVWRADVLRFIRDHVDAAEIYRLSASDLEFGELLPPKPGWLEQDAYEERTRVGFMVERATKVVDGLAAAAHRHCQHHAQQAAIERDPRNRTTRGDTGDGSK